MDFDRFNAIVEERPNYGELDEASVVSEFKNSGCGDNYRIYLQVKDEIIEKASYTTTGCSFSLASLSIICGLLKDKTLTEAKNITTQEIEDVIDGFPERRLLYAQTAIDAIIKAVEDYQNDNGLPSEEINSRKSVLAKLEKQGHLRDTNLRSSMLDGLDLSNVDFSGADMRNSYLRNANLSGANLANVNLMGAFLDKANLTNAIFSDADLRYVKMLGIKIENTDFTNALYDIGTRVLPSDIHIFDVMIKKGKELYVKS